MAKQTNTAPQAQGGQVDERVIAADLAAVAAARSFVRSRCHAIGLEPDLCDTAVLLTSEVVANAILHGHSEARLRVRGHQHYLRVEVADENSRHPQPQAADPDALDGRGLAECGHRGHACGALGGRR